MVSERIESDYNQFNGVNPILQSRLQLKGGWPMFHNQHIYKIAEVLNSILPSEYYATTDDPLRIQKSRIEPDDLILKRHPATIYHSKRRLAPQPPHPSPSKSYTGVLEVADEEYQSAVLIHKRTESGDWPITRFELLSPTNVSPMGSGSVAELGISAYNLKRTETLAAGINLVEIHYLDYHPPTIALRNYVPNYAVEIVADRASTATAYHAAITRPLALVEVVDSEIPNGDKHQLPIEVTVYSFGVEDRIPTIAVPLAGDDAPVHLDLQAVYDAQFFDQRWGIGVNYAVSIADVGMEHHSLADRTAFIGRILTILDAVDRGVDLETGEKLERIQDAERLRGIAEHHTITIEAN